jgi:hypothetical protein
MRTPRPSIGGDAESIDRAHRVDVGAAVDAHAVHGGHPGERVGGPDGAVGIEGKVISGGQVGEHLVEVPGNPADRLAQLPA